MRTKKQQIIMIKKN